MVVHNYLTILQNTSTTIVIEKSKFIAQLKKVESEENAFEFFQETKKKYFDATHNCTAFILKAGQMRSSDDGEPAGTAGKPILECLKKNNISDIACVVTRYFGGTKLGTGGLIRAYSSAVQNALVAAGTVHLALLNCLKIKLSYAQWSKLESFLKANQVYYGDLEFLEDIKCSIFVEDGASWKAKILDFCNGSVVIENGASQYVPLSHK